MTQKSTVYSYDKTRASLNTLAERIYAYIAESGDIEDNMLEQAAEAFRYSALARDEKLSEMTTTQIKAEQAHAESLTELLSSLRFDTEQAGEALAEHILTARLECAKYVEKLAEEYKIAVAYAMKYYKDISTSKPMSQWD